MSGEPRVVHCNPQAPSSSLSFVGLLPSANEKCVFFPEEHGKLSLSHPHRDDH